MDLVDEQHVVRFEVGEDRGEIARPFEHRAGGVAQVHAHLAGDDVRERGLAQARRPEQEHVVQRLLPPARGLDEDRKLAADLLLPDVLGERAGAQRALEGLLLRARRGGGNQPVGFNRHRRASYFNGNYPLRSGARPSTGSP